MTLIASIFLRRRRRASKENQNTFKHTLNTPLLLHRSLFSFFFISDWQELKSTDGLRPLRGCMDGGLQQVLHLNVAHPSHQPPTESIFHPSWNLPSCLLGYRFTAGCFRLHCIEQNQEATAISLSHSLYKTHFKKKKMQQWLSTHILTITEISQSSISPNL